MDPDRLARFRDDPYARSMGFELLEAAPGRARVTVEVTAAMLNFAGRPHGGFLFGLADYAFAAASNARGHLAVATSVTIHFLAAPQVGDRLIAEAREIGLGARAGFYEMTVADGSGRTIARCLGVVHRTNREL